MWQKKSLINIMSNIPLFFLILLILMVWSKQKERGDLFTLFFIMIVGLIAHWLGSDYVTAILAMIGILVANGLQPIFYPLVSNYDSKTETYITRRCLKSFFISKDLDSINELFKDADKNKFDNQFNSYLYRNFIFTMKLPLIQIFDKTKIPFPTKEIEIINDDLNYKIPGIEIPIKYNNSLLLKTSLTGWSVAQIDYPVKICIKLEKFNVLKVSNEVRETNGKYYITVEVVNNENFFIDYYEFFGDDHIDEDDWNKIKNIHNFIIGEKKLIRNFREKKYVDRIGFYKGNTFGIIQKLGPRETRFYTIENN